MLSRNHPEIDAIDPEIDARFGGRINSLRHRHDELEAQIADEESRPAPDSTALAALKRQKLGVVSELAALAGR